MMSQRYKQEHYKYMKGRKRKHKCYIVDTGCETGFFRKYKDARRYARKNRIEILVPKIYKDRYRGNLVYPFTDRYAPCVIFLIFCFRMPLRTN